MADCYGDFSRLRRRIYKGAKPHEDRTARLSRLLRDVRKMQQSCRQESKVLEILALQMFGSISTDETIERLLPLAADPQLSPFARIAAYGRCAALAYKNPAWARERQHEFRQNALILCKENSLTFEAFVILANWLFAATYEEDIDAAESIVEQIKSLGPIPEGGNRVERADAREWRARYKTHLAKYFLLKARDKDSKQACAFLNQANELYASAAREGGATDDHRRVNVYIEWASRLIDLAKNRSLADMMKIENALEAAHRSLDSHVCDMCRAYYFETAGELAELKGDLLFNIDRPNALQFWRASLTNRRESLRLYRSMQHHFTTEEEQMISNLEARLNSETAPRKIFLSHKGVDKEMVRRFHVVLQELGFEPWLDEAELTAGKRIHRDIQRGFKQSCACVFFVTEKFKDERYIAAEIDHANTEYTERGEGEFVVITIAFGGALVPDSLRRWVYKNCEFELQALLEILRALPLRVGSVHARMTNLTAPPV